uniref:Uncharacterized protein n=1 Tax=Romanomermis culicivorax TaxID=13658 RepID=A0A915L774_ROMCU
MNLFMIFSEKNRNPAADGLLPVPNKLPKLLTIVSTPNGSSGLTQVLRDRAEAQSHWQTPSRHIDRSGHMDDERHGSPTPTLARHWPSIDAWKPHDFWQAYLYGRNGTEYNRWNVTEKKGNFRCIQFDWKLPSVVSNKIAVTVGRFPQNYIRAIYTCLFRWNGIVRQQLSLKIHFRSETTPAILGKTTDGNVQPNRTERKLSFPSARLNSVPFGEKGTYK